jgi:hypothetical protein
MRLLDRIHISIILSFIASLSACTYAPKNTTVDNTYNARLMAIGGDSASEGLTSTTHEDEQYQVGDETRDTCNDQPEISNVQFALSNASKNHLQTRYLTLGSTKDEVARIQGTPTRIWDHGSAGSWWEYGDSMIEFDSKGLIKAWNNQDKNLNVNVY